MAVEQWMAHACMWPSVIYLRCKNIQVLDYLMRGSRCVRWFEVTDENLLLRFHVDEMRSHLPEEPPVLWGQSVLALFLVYMSWVCS